MDSYETIDFLEADSQDEAEKAAAVISTHGKVKTRVTRIKTWRELLVSLKEPAPNSG